MSVLVLGDIHIGGSCNLGRQVAGSIFNSRITDRCKQLDWVLERALENDVKHIVLTGDIFEDPKPHYSLVVLFIDWLSKCTDSDMCVHIIAGNHDILRSGQFTTSPLDIISSADLQNVFVYKKINTIHLDDIGITFLPFRDRRSFNTDVNSDAINLLKAQIPYEVASIGDDCLKVLIGHLALEGAIPAGHELDELTNELHCPLEIFKGYDYVWMGHVHKFQVMSQKPYISHIGSMDISDFGEFDHKKYIVIIDPKKDQQYRYIEIPTRPLKSISIQLPENVVNATTYINNELNKIKDYTNSIVKLVITLPSNSSYNIDRNILEKNLYKSGTFYVSKISEERKFVSLKKQINETISNTVNEISAIKTYSSLIEDTLRSDFISTAASIVQEYKENLK